MTSIRRIILPSGRVIEVTIFHQSEMACWVSKFINALQEDQILPEDF